MLSGDLTFWTLLMEYVSICVLYLCVGRNDVLGEVGNNTSPHSPLQIITLASWSDGVIISPASGYRKWPHALFTHAKMLIDDSFIYIFPLESFLLCFIPWYTFILYSQLTAGLYLFDIHDVIPRFGISSVTNMTCRVQTLFEIKACVWPTLKLVPHLYYTHAI